MKLLRWMLLVGFVGIVIGCSKGDSDPAKTTPTGPSPEEMKKLQEESKKKGGYKSPGGNR